MSLIIFFSRLVQLAGILLTELSLHLKFLLPVQNLLGLQLKGNNNQIKFYIVNLEQINTHISFSSYPNASVLLALGIYELKLVSPTLKFFTHSFLN
jgi:hypothetical protein